jgi:hypothetical protein
MMTVDLIRDAKVTRLLVTRERIRIQLAAKDDKYKVISFLTNVGNSIMRDEEIQVSMRGVFETSKILMNDDKNKFKRRFKM